MELKLAILIVTILHSKVWIGETKTVKEVRLDGSSNRFNSGSSVQEFVLTEEGVHSDSPGAGKYSSRSSNDGDQISQRIKTSDDLSSPFFQHSKYIGTISENEPVGTSVNIIGHITACCKNSPSYSLESEMKYFNLNTVYFGNEHNNILVSRHSFDREITDLYRVRLKAHCSNGHTAETVIEVHILNKNDNVPQFNQAALVIETSTDQSWGKIATFSAQDLDQNDRIIYTIEGNMEFFIDSDTGDLYAENDYLFQGSYDLKVFASDSAGHISEPLDVHIIAESDVLKYRSFHNPGSHQLSKRATTTIARAYDIVENSTTTSELFSVASVKPRPPAEKYALVSASVDMFLPPNNDGSVYLKPGMKLDYEDENQREILVIFNRTDLNTPEGMLLLSLIDLM